MRGQFDGWNHSSHKAVAGCNDCHTPHRFPDKWIVKGINAIKLKRSPLVIETEVTEPVIRALAGSPDVRALRGTSHMGYSFVYVILEDPGRRAALSAGQRPEVGRTGAGSAEEEDPVPGLAEQGGGRRDLVGRTDHDPLRPQEVLDRVALPQELRVRHHREGMSRRARHDFFDAPRLHA